MHKISAILAGIVLIGQVAYAQTEQVDTLTASKIVSAVEREAFSVKHVDADGARKVVTPLGEGDIVKYVQTLPGVSSGAEGFSSYYAHGGNQGNNLILLDGNPLYGSGHILGLTTSYSSMIVSDSYFRMGGFEGTESNMLSSVIGITTTDGNFEKTGVQATSSNFLVGGQITAPLKRDRCSFVLTGRISPIGMEYGLLKSMLDKSDYDFPDEVGATAYDVQGKLTFKISEKSKLAFSTFYSRDRYNYSLDADGMDEMGWDNLISYMLYERVMPKDWRFNARAAYNRYNSIQSQYRNMGGVDNKYDISSMLQEGTVAAGFIKDKLKYDHKLGLQFDMASMAPYTYGSRDGKYADYTSTEHVRKGFLYYQIETSPEERLRIKAMARGNLYYRARVGDTRFTFNPEGALYVNYNFTREVGAAFSADYLTQYYHLLEGLPLGWSVEPRVASSNKLKPEHAAQAYAGMYWDKKPYHLSLGGYYKKYYNLTYFAEAKNLFNSSLAGWESGAKSGEGTSYGLELQAEKNGDRLSWTVAYTLSKTGRHFADINGGERFRAKFDRPHILNVTGEYSLLKDERREYGLNTFFTFQSGNLETVKDGVYQVHHPILGDLETDHFGKENNFRMPSYIRWDLGAYFKWKGARVTHALNAGIYNVLNRHNPMCLYLDGNTLEYYEISLFPIMPSLNYKIEF